MGLDLIGYDGVAYIPESIIIDILDGCMLGG